jgi:hypothetical protein
MSVSVNVSVNVGAMDSISSVNWFSRYSICICFDELLS